MYCAIIVIWGDLMNDYEIIDDYGYKDYEYLYEVLDYSLEHMNITNATFCVTLTSDEEVHKLNRDYRGIDRTTDVLSFALEDNEDIKAPIRQLGDIIISIPKMKSQAIEYGHSEKRELSFLAVHGFLHLLGYDHTRSIEEEKIQFGLQDEILEHLNIID